MIRNYYVLHALLVHIVLVVFRRKRIVQRHVGLDFLFMGGQRPITVAVIVVAQHVAVGFVAIAAVFRQAETCAGASVPPDCGCWLFRWTWSVSLSLHTLGAQQRQIIIFFIGGRIEKKRGRYWFIVIFGVAVLVVIVQ